MRQNPSFVKISLSDSHYLLPVGQSRSDLQRGIQMNETGSYLWSLLEEDISLQELVCRAREYFNIEDSQKDSFGRDIAAFLEQLNQNGMILSKPADLPCQAPCRHQLSIAGLTLNLYGPEEAFSPDFLPFFAQHTRADQNVFVLFGTPLVSENGTLIIRNKELTVMELPEKYILLFHNDSCVRELHLSKDAANVYAYCIPATDFPQKNSPEFSKSPTKLQEDLFHALRFAFLYLAQCHSMVAVHSASIDYRGKAWLFSAPSHTGKSTHASLWHTLQNTPYINGDLNLISMKKTPLVHGTPWCGTSGLFDTDTHELGGIIFLRQASGDMIDTLSRDEKIISLTNRMISPAWDSSMLIKQIEIAKQIADQTLICRLNCTPNASAQILLQKEIDHYLDDH